MASFLRSCKTEIGSSLKQVVSGKTEKARFQKKKMSRKPRIQSLLINIQEINVTWHAPQTQSKGTIEEGKKIQVLW